MSIFNKQFVQIGGYNPHDGSSRPFQGNGGSVFNNSSAEKDKDKVIKKLDEILGRSDNNTWNIYNNNPQVIKHSSIISRKPIDSSKDIPLYVKIGNSVCNSCKIIEIIHGFHYPENVDLCNKCFFLASTIQDKSNWIEFNAE